MPNGIRFERGVWHCYAPFVTWFRDWRRSVGVWAVAVTLLVGIGQPWVSTRAAELPAIQDRGVLIVAVKDNLRPLGFRTAEGQLAGLEIDLAHRLAEVILGDPNAVDLRPVANADRLSAVTEGVVDLAIAHLSATGTRARIVTFSLPYYVDGTALVTRNPSVAELSDLRTKTIGVLDGSSAIAVVRSILPIARLLGVASYEAGLALLESGQADAFAADATVLTGWVQEYPRYRLLPSLLSAQALSVALPRGLQYDSLRQRVNSAITQFYESGWLQERIRYWGLPE